MGERLNLEAWEVLCIEEPRGAAVRTRNLEWNLNLTGQDTESPPF